MIRKAAMTWIVMIPVAILNGIVRQALFEPQVGELPAHQLSVVTGSAAFFALICAMLHREAPQQSDRWLRGLGAVWVAATGAFEFVFGHVVMGNPWSRLLADYNVLAGRLWLVVLAVIAISPLAVKRLAMARDHDRVMIGHVAR